jgi:hypothetical protein
LAVLETQVLGLLERQLMQPGLVAEFVTAFNLRLEQATAELRAQAASSQRERTALDRKIANLVDAISEGRSSAAIMAKLGELEAQRDLLTEAATQPVALPPALHPGIADMYAAHVGKLIAELANGSDAEALQAARPLIDKVIIHPPQTDGDPPGVELIGDLIGLLKAAGLGQRDAGEAQSSADPVLDLFASSIKAGPGAEPLALPALPSLAPRRGLRHMPRAAFAR